MSKAMPVARARAAQCLVSALLVEVRAAEDRVGTRFPKLSERLLEISGELDQVVEQVERREAEVDELARLAGVLAEDADRTRMHDRAEVGEAIGSAILCLQMCVDRLSPPISDPIVLAPTAVPENSNVVAFPGREGGAS